MGDIRRWQGGVRAVVRKHVHDARLVVQGRDHVRRQAVDVLGVQVRVRSVEQRDLATCPPLESEAPFLFFEIQAENYLGSVIVPTPSGSMCPTLPIPSPQPASTTIHCLHRSVDDMQCDR